MWSGRVGIGAALLLPAAARSVEAPWIFDLNRGMPCSSGCSGGLTVDKLGSVGIGDLADWRLSIAQGGDRLSTSAG